MRVSTSDTWQSALLNLQTAQQQQSDAATEVSTQKIATDLMGFGRGSSVIATYQSTLSTTNGYLSVNSTVADRLTSQDSALATTAQAASDAKDSMMGALANGDGTSLMLALQGNFSTALDGLNYQHDGQYLFGGGNDNVAPVNVNSLSALGALGSTADSAFSNGSVKKSSQIDPNSTIQTGMLASDLGKQMLQTFQDIQNYNDDPSTGPFGAQLTDAQKTFLTTKSQEFSTEYTQLLQQQAVNGTLQKQVTSTTTSLTGQVSQLQTLISGKTDADLATAATNLQQAQVAVQASAQVLSSLNQYSLLNYLK
jgi:flagellar hook-associated protein 3 FlgL